VTAGIFFWVDGFEAAFGREWSNLRLKKFKEAQKGFTSPPPDCEDSTSSNSPTTFSMESTMTAFESKSFATIRGIHLSA